MAAIKRFLYLQAAFEHVPQFLLRIVAMYLRIVQARIIVHLFGCQMQSDFSIPEILKRNLKQVLPMVAVGKAHKGYLKHVLQVRRNSALHISCQLQGEIGGHACGYVNDRYSVG